jgi:hypothetical protein
MARKFNLMGLISGIPAAAKYLYGRSSLGQKAGLVGLYAGGSLTFNALLDSFEERQRAYYGDARYNSYYKGGVETLKGVSSLAGIGLSGLALIDRDPISRLINSTKYRFAREKGLLKRLKGGRDYVESSGRATPFSFARDTEFLKITKGRTTALLEDRLKKLKKAPRFGVTSMLIAANLAGTNISSVLSNIPAGDITKYSVMGLGAVGAIGVGWAAKKFLPGSTIMGFGATAAGGYLGYKVGGAHNHTTAEGNIIDFRAANESGVSRMNFSTAGLTLALHKNNRKF